MCRGGIEGFRIAGKQGIGIIAACQVALMGGPEYARQVGIRSLEPVGVFLPGTQNYPGGKLPCNELEELSPLGRHRGPSDFNLEPHSGMPDGMPNTSATA